MVISQYEEPLFPVFYVLEVFPGTYWLTATMILDNNQPFNEDNGIAVNFPQPITVGTAESIVGVNLVLPLVTEEGDGQ